MLKIISTLGALTLLISLLILKNNMNIKTINIIYPTHLLKSDVSLLNPKNTETVAEYYLLENLSCGLVRDSKYSSTGYEGCIAEKFYLENKSTWVFHIRNLKWSTGTDVSKAEIQNWISSIRSSQSRHVRFLRFAKGIEYDELTRVLRIKFPFEVDDTILHELSLADAGLFPVNYKDNGWSVTVGPYRVVNWNVKEFVLELAANQYSPFYTKDMPQKVKLFKILSPEDREKIFTSLEVDVSLISPPASPKILAPIISKSPQIYKGHPTAIAYFVLNKKNEFASKFDNRKIFNNIISEFRTQVQSLAGKVVPIFPEDQMIPEGFKGRLNKKFSIEMKNDVSQSGLLKQIIIKIKTDLKDYYDLMSGLKNFFLQKGINLEFDYSPDPTVTSKHFATIHSFLGNQLDPSGSWAFLAGPPDGPLSDWFSEYKFYYESAYNSQDLRKRAENLDRLHEEILNECIAIPFGISQPTYLLSDHVDPSRWNPFDSRMRIYELRWK